MIVFVSDLVLSIRSPCDLFRFCFGESCNHVGERGSTELLDAIRKVCSRLPGQLGGPPQLGLCLQRINRPTESGRKTCFSLVVSFIGLKL